MKISRYIALHKGISFYQPLRDSFTLLLCHTKIPGNFLLQLNIDRSQLCRANFNMNGHVDLNSTYAAQSIINSAVDSSYRHVSLAIPTHQDDADVRLKYHLFLPQHSFDADDWFEQLELSTVHKMAQS
jgi:hypothetical protein